MSQRCYWNAIDLTASTEYRRNQSQQRYVAIVGVLLSFFYTFNILTFYFSVIL